MFIEKASPPKLSPVGAKCPKIVQPLVTDNWGLKIENHLERNTSD